MRVVSRQSILESILMPVRLFPAAVLCALLATGCSGVTPAPETPAPSHPVRFLLTFDDGPSPALTDNPTAKIIQTLADNPTQAGIKGIFFVQTRSPTAGGSQLGQHLMQRVAAEDHVLAVHSGSARGHINHRTLDSQTLAATLADACNDIRAISGESIDLVRPPFWSFDARTLSVYDQSNMEMLLTDLRAGDGLQWWIQADPETGGRLRNDFRYFRQRLAAGYIAAIDEVIPVVVTFHDTNHYTADHLAMYLTTLVRTARETGLAVADPPFYADHSQVLRAAHARTNNHATRADLAP